MAVAPGSPRPGAFASPAHPPRRRSISGAQHLARAARDPAVGIADFHFTPAPVTIHVGDTVTWTNSGPSGHTATARDGSFDTGLLSRGHSASHRFTAPGTYAYFCSIHPFMHGTVTVLAATTARPVPAAASPSSTVQTTPTNSTNQPTTPTNSTNQPTTPTTSTNQPTTPTNRATTATAAPSLPNTGLPVNQEVGAGLALVTLGLLARWAVLARRT
ncbi:MAG: plastocyanin/azurin family copper-binding protein [Solirubrobacteraceae bacterium]